jgi:hypothetical protein
MFAGSGDDRRQPKLSAEGLPQDRLALEAGQSWTYCDAPNAASRVVIGRIDQLSGIGTVVSVSITNVPVSGGGPRSSEFFDVFHAPITADALLGTLLEHVGTGTPSPGFEEAYADWRNSLEAGEAGVFTISPVGVISLYGRVRK